MAGVEDLVQQDLVHPVVCNNPSASHFETSIKVFVRKQFTVPDSIAPPPPETLDSGRCPTTSPNTYFCANLVEPLTLAKQRSPRMFSTDTLLSIALQSVVLVPMILEDHASTVSDTPSRLDPK
ncbi:hypothetical protein BGZ95_007277 [Linnemannia exigua]|uniref:Uncharacterized protein n=1 Tax=Linnemannia exigua TaxID=604196 RepID=A0AAD4DH16_9FUNG|nr:hypothetical protein BGZ95_007277 [Linnemannia exigua]